MKGATKVLAMIGCGAALATLVVACLPDRFPVCKTNEECAARSADTPVCYNLRCLECHYDADCDGGRTCNVSSHCASVSDVHPDSEGDAGAAPASPAQ